MGEITQAQASHVHHLRRLAITRTPEYTFTVNTPAKILSIFIVSSASVLVLAMNIVASQLVFPNLMFRLLSDTTVDAAREFLGNLPEGDVRTSQYRIYDQKYQNIFSEEAKVSGLNKNVALDHYNKLLVVSPRNPQLIAKIGMLESDEAKLTIAQDIDPWLNLPISNKN